MKDDSSEGSSSYYGPGVICCSVNTFACANFGWGFFSLAFFVLGLVGLLTNEGFLLLFVEEVYITLTVFGGVSFFVVILGMIGACAKVEIFFICHIFLMGLLFFGQSLAIIFLALYLNEVGTLGQLDDAANGEQARFEDQLIDFANAEPAKWIDTQNQFDCCGISAAAGVDFQTGDSCLEAEFEFCLDTFAELIFDIAPYVGAAAGVLLLFQFGAIVAAIRMYWVPVWRGGWMFDEEELEQMAEEKELKLPKPEIQGGGAISVLRNAGNRLSFRVQNAIKPNPNMPQGAGFLKRLSYTGGGAAFGMPNPNNRGAGFGAPGPKPQPGFNPNSAATSGLTYGGGGPPRRNRLSNRLSAGFQAFGTAFGQMRNNFKPTPPAPPKQPVAPPGYAGAPPPGIGSNGNEYGGQTYTPQRAAANSFGQSPREPANSYGQPPREPANSYGQPPRQPANSYGQPPRQPANSYGQPPRQPANSYGQPPREPANSYGQPPRQPANSYGSRRETNNSYGAPPGPPPPNTWNNTANVMDNSRPNVSSAKWNSGGSNRGMNRNNSDFKTASSSNRLPQVSSTPSKKASKGGLNKFYSKKKSKKSKTSFGGRGRATKVKSPLAAQNGGLLAQIQNGKGLKPTVTNDRSAPKV